MQITISTKAVLGFAATALLGVGSWFAVGHIEYGNRLSRLEDSAQNDARQDSELTEVRATMRDLIRLTAELAARDSGPLLAPTLPPATAATTNPPPADTPGERPEDALEPEYGEFRMEQADLESILRSRGIKPTEKRLRDQ